MDLFSILAACAAMAGDPQAEVTVDPSHCEHAETAYRAELQSLHLTAGDRDAIARVAFAEAANQGDSGLAGVVYTIINRLISGEWGSTVTQVVNAPRQFEPVHRAGGWEQLPPLPESQKARVDTIINLAVEGRLPDLTNGARFFQNPAIVANRESAGTVSSGLTHFGGSAPSAVIKDHTFYASINFGGGNRQPIPAAEPAPLAVQAERRREAPEWDIFGKSQDMELQQAQAWDVFSAQNGGTQ